MQPTTNLGGASNDGKFMGSRWSGFGPTILACFVLGIALNFGSLRSADDADCWVSTLNSLQRFTPYEWGANRFGSLAPLLCIWIRDPLVNHFCENALCVGTLLGAAFLLKPFSQTIPVREWACMTLWGILLVLGNSQIYYLSSYSHPYSLSFFLGMSGWSLGKRIRAEPVALLCAGFCFFISIWVNVAFAPWLVMTMFCRDPWCRRTWALSALAAGSFGLNLYLASLSPIRVPFQFGMSQDPVGTASLLLLNFLQRLRPLPLLLWVMASFGSLRVLRRREPQFGVELWRIARPLLLSSLVYWIFLSFAYWIQVNDANPRYLSPVAWSFMIVSSAPMARLLAGSGRAPWAFAALALCGVLRFGVHTPEYWLATWTKPEVNALKVLKEQKARVLVGEYWSTWNRVFLANVQAYREGRQLLWGCSPRCENTRDLWQPEVLTGATIALTLSQEELTFRWLSIAQIPLEGKNFFPTYVDPQLVVGKWLDETPQPTYLRYEALPLAQDLAFSRPAIWKYLGQGWTAPDPKLGGRRANGHQADIRFAARNGEALILSLQVRPYERLPQRFGVFLNGLQLGQGQLEKAGEIPLQISLPGPLVKEHNVFSLRFADSYYPPEGVFSRSLLVMRMRLDKP